jgi:Fur family ferric uptake transcriptional regulator
MRIVFIYTRRVPTDPALPPGVRATAQRRAVLAAVGRSDGRFTVAELHERARRLEPRLGLATTYRTLDLLRASGAVHPLQGEGLHAYVRCRPEHHHHLVCTSCGTVEETEVCAAPAETELHARHGFTPRHELDIYGTCRSCG